ncbi:unnamed protein product [Leptosia nina]|uniref:Uncharacterized protein n=1 Tax=Leptosia nina TaxID=320188 RepID=A0AAV1J466_9NEOP
MSLSHQRIILVLASFSCASADNLNKDKRSLPSHFYSQSDDFSGDICPRYIENNRFNIDKLADVWQTVYHSAPDKVPCFKMLIKKVGEEERKSNQASYGLLSDDVHWDNCTLEIKATGVQVVKRRHFLQQTIANHGILLNIIIEMDTTNHLIHDNPDQWFVMKNLLTVRDCSTGDLVIFSRVPYQPGRDVIESLLDKFKNKEPGSWTCDETLKPIIRN